MALLKRNQAPQFTREQIMRSRPVRNTMVQWETNEEGKIIISIPRRSDWVARVLSIVFYIPKTPVRLILDDEVGSSVWEICDGEHTIQGIVDHLCKKYKLTRKEAEVSVTEFLRQLGKRRLLGFAVDKVP